MTFRYWFFIIVCFAVGGFLLYQSATMVPLVSELEVVTGRIAAIQEKNGYGVRRTGGVSIRLHQHPVTFQYYTATDEDHELIKQGLTEGDTLTLWTAPALFEREYNIWRLQKDDEVLLSYDYIRDSYLEQQYFFLGGLFFVWCGFFFIYVARRRRYVRSKHPYAL